MKWERTKTHAADSFISAYINEDESLEPFFDYKMDETAEKKRLKELENYSFDRETLASILRDYNNRLGRDQVSANQIERLKNPDSVVVIGGQQSGLLGGPMYTAHKMISIVVEAARLEEYHDVPVIPVFWIAGEDHDIDEVNHTFFTDGSSTKKIRIPEKNAEKIPVSERTFSKEDAFSVLVSAIQFLPETNVTSELLAAVKADIDKASTYTEWFARWMDKIFPNTPLLLIDAHDERLREFERPYFREMVNNSPEIRRGFLAKAEELKRSGWGEPIALDRNNAHLFIHTGEERHLLKFIDGSFINEQTGQQCTKQELTEKVDEHSAKLSNNVVTRPVMQDLVFPVLTFIGGPGEVKYWGALAEVFHVFNHSMPIVKPRLQVTFIPRKAEKTMNRYDLRAKDILQNGVEHKKEQIVQKNASAAEAELFAQAKETLNKTADRLIEQLPDQSIHDRASARFSADLRRAVTDFERKIHAEREQQNSHHLYRLDGLMCWLMPDGVLQERRLNAMPLMNLYGWDVLQRTQNELLANKQTIEPGDHIFIYL